MVTGQQDGHWAMKNYNFYWIIVRSIWVFSGLLIIFSECVRFSCTKIPKRFSAFFIVVYSNLSSFLLQPSYFLAILFPLFPCIPALSVVLHVVSGKVSARIPAPQWHPRWYNLPQSLKNGTSISKNIQDFFERKPINFCVAISKKTSVKNFPQKIRRSLWCYGGFS